MRLYFDNTGVLSDFIHVGETVNGKYYTEFLRTSNTKDATALLNTGVVLIEDKQRQVNLIRLNQYSWEVLPHPSYSLGLIPTPTFPETKNVTSGSKIRRP